MWRTMHQVRVERIGASLLAGCAFAVDGLVKSFESDGIRDPEDEEATKPEYPKPIDQQGDPPAARCHFVVRPSIHETATQESANGWSTLIATDGNRLNGRCVGTFLIR